MSVIFSSFSKTLTTSTESPLLNRMLRLVENEISSNPLATSITSFVGCAFEKRVDENINKRNKIYFINFLRSTQFYLLLKNHYKGNTKIKIKILKTLKLKIPWKNKKTRYKWQMAKSRKRKLNCHI